MPIVTRCHVTGCRTLTIGDVCLVHDLRPTRSFVRGRPFVPGRPAVPVLAVPAARTTAARVALFVSVD